ncbi:hypothetical protein [Daejeonella sp.]|uniref:hypothetical protein n=1 Tax=Daejeonella sp. TaxID=2805397 RepID=UPI0039837E92
MYEFDKVTVAGDFPQLIDDILDVIVNVFIGIGVFVDEAAGEVMTPAIYNLYFCEDFTVTVMLFKA